VWRLPLVAPKAENEARIRTVLDSLELLGSAAAPHETAAQSLERVHAATAN
jgi:hypothetical protein